ncbi:hypothetical protein COOONC_15717 [Cooperia oncophora]
MFRKLCTFLLITAIIHNAAPNAVNRVKRWNEAGELCRAECEAIICPDNCHFDHYNGHHNDCKHVTCIIPL